MSQFASGLYVFVLLGSSAWGWGWATGRLCYGKTFIGWVFPLTLGLAVIGVIGGGVNSLGIAYPATLWVILGAGWLLLAMAIHNLRHVRPNLAWSLVVGGVSLLVLLFLTATLMPSPTLNFHDDLHTYLARPVRMLQTGTLSGGWFDLLGFDSLGGHDFFKALVLLVLPLEYINGFDGVFCTALAVAMAGEIARRLQVHLVFAFLAMGSLILINPQTVNVSALYAGSVFIQGLLLAVFYFYETRDLKTGRFSLGAATVVAIFLSTLIALKVTLAIFAALFSILWLGAALVFDSKRKKVLLAAGTTLLATIGALLPWLILHGENYLSGLTRWITGEGKTTESDGPAPAGASALFSDKDLFYGGSYLDYFLPVGSLLVAGILALFLLRRRSGTGLDKHLIIISSASLATATAYLVYPYLTDLGTAVRYICPILIAVAPMVIASTGRCCLSKRFSSEKLTGLSLPNLAIGVTLAVSIAVIFGQVFLQRVYRIVENRTLLSFPITESYIAYCRDALSEEAREKARSAQELTEPSTTILVRTSQPYHLDYSRNQILNASEPALIVPWLELPMEKGAEPLRAYLLARGVRYILWEMAGPGTRNQREYLPLLKSNIPMMRRAALKQLIFLSRLKKLLSMTKVVYNAKYTFLLDLEADSER